MALSSIFNRQNIARGVILLTLVDLFGYAGENGKKILDSNQYTRPAKPYYGIAGQIGNFAWIQTKTFFRDLNRIVQKHNP